MLRERDCSFSFWAMNGAKIQSLLAEAEEIVLVGDVHGRGSALERLLKELKWSGTASEGFTRPDRSILLFVGDLIDRGHENRKVVETVRRLCDDGLAVCLMGNHEYNAVLYHTWDPERGEHLRPHGGKNDRQHETVLREYAGHEADLAEMIDWFRTLPLAVESDTMRVVHACWAPRDRLDLLERSGGSWFIPPDDWAKVCRKGSAAYETIQVVLKGPEMDLPGGASFVDKDGTPRRKARVKWWKEKPATWLEAVFLPQEAGLVIDPETAYEGEQPYAYRSAERPVFFGHYWRDAPFELQATNAACLDYSAGKDGCLVAYRFRGESILCKSNTVSVPAL